MKIAFLGDSITEAKPGVSYVDIIQKKFPNYQLDNFGKGGDTVLSLYKRVKKIEKLSEYDSIVLFIGVNDVFGKLTTGFKILKALRRQRAARDGDVFILNYKTLLDFLVEKNKNIIIIPPLLIGEDETNQWNQILLQYETRIELLTKQYPTIAYLDVHKRIYEYLQDKETSDYLPLSVIQIGKDLSLNDTDIDKVANERGLHVTLDGVHLNSKGANFVAKNIIKYFNDTK